MLTRRLTTRLLGAAAAAVLFASATTAIPSAAIAQTKWQMPTGYADGNFHTQNIKQFAADVAKATEGKLSITVHSGASLFKLPEIKRAVQSGQVALGETLMASLANEDPMFEADTVPFLAQGFDAAKRLSDATRPYVEKRLETQNLKLLFAVPWPTQGIFTNKPINSADDLRGVKFRTYNSTTSRFAELLGAIPATVQASEVPQAFATGIIQAMVTSTTTGFDTQAWDYVKYYYDIRAMHSKNMVVVNRKAFEALDPAVRAKLVEVASAAEARGWEMARKLETEMNAKLQEKGVQLLQPGPDLQQALAKVRETMAAEWSKRAGPDGQTVLAALK